LALPSTFLLILAKFLYVDRCPGTLARGKIAADLGDVAAGLRRGASIA
jgi:hypothetical protein